MNTNHIQPNNETDQAPLVNPFSEFNIGSLLLRMGKITPQDAERIMQLHKENGMRFGEAAQSLGLVTSEDIQQALARQFDYPYLVHERGVYMSELVAAYQPFSAKAETLRDIRSQLMLHWFSSGRKMLAVAGVNSGDGVSNFVANLAVVFAQLGENTLLIDANLRNPRIHQLFDIAEKRGLSDILAGRANEEVITRIDSFDNLSVLSAGTLPPNPQELVSRHVFREKLNELSSKYDVVLIDTPAFSNGSDVQAISVATGGAVLVVRKNKTRAAEVVYASEQLRKNGSQIVGSVLVEF
jgi:protein-tyrosine kinase